MTESTPGGSGDKPTGSESASDASDRVVFRDDMTDKEYSKQVRRVADTYHGRLQAIDAAKDRDRKDFTLYKDAGDGQFAVQGAPGEDMVLVDTVQSLDDGSVTRSLSIRTDPDGGVKVKVSEGDRRGFEYSGDGKTTKLFDTAIHESHLLLSGDQRQAALGNIANDINAFGDSIAAEEAVFLPPPDLPQ